MKTRWLLRLAVLLAPAAAAQGCSLINSYDEVKSGGDSGNPLIEAGTVDVSVPLDDGGGTDGQPDGPPVDASDAQVGVVVVSGLGAKDGGTIDGAAIDAGSEYVLAVLDPVTGKQLSRETMPMIASFFDGQRELWYLIEAPVGFVLPSGPFSQVDVTDPVFLHVRTLDTHTGVWTELAKTRIPAPTSVEQVLMLKDRLAYVRRAFDGGSEPMVVYNTSNPAALNGDASVAAATVTPLPFKPIGLIPTRYDNGNAGGLVTLIRQDPCDVDAGTCTFSIVGATATDAVTPKLTSTVIATSAVSSDTVGWGSQLTGTQGTDVIVRTNTGSGGGGIVERYSPLTNAKLGVPPIAFPATSNRFRPVVVSECLETVFVSHLNAPDLFAIPLQTGGTIASINLGHNGSSVVYEPYTNTLFAPDKGQFTPIAVTGTVMAPKLAARTASNMPFTPPADLKPYHIATRQPLPLPFACPK